MAGVKAGQSTGRKNRSIDDLLLGFILPLLILAIAVAALYIILVFDSGKDQKLVDPLLGFSFHFLTWSLVTCWGGAIRRGLTDARCQWVSPMLFE